MKRLQKFKRVMGLAMVASSTLAMQAHAQDIQSKNEAEQLKITGSLKISNYYDFPAAKNQKNYPKLNQYHNAGLGLKQVLPWGKDTIALIGSIKLGRDKVVLKRLNAEFKNFIIGLADSNFCDPDALANTLLGDDTPGTVGGRGVQITWKQALDQGISYAIGLEESYTGKFAHSLVLEEKEKKAKAKVQNHIPAMGAYVKYGQDFGYIRLAGLLRPGMSGQPGLGGVNLTSVLDILPEQTSLKLAGIYGQGLGEYLAGSSLLEKKVAAIGATKNNKPVLLGTVGGSVGVEHQWLPDKLRSTLALGILSVTDTKAYGTANKAHHTDFYKRSLYASLNLTYHFTDHIMCGIEYIHDRLWALDSKGDANKNRVQAAVGFKL